MRRSRPGLLNSFIHASCAAGCTQIYEWISFRYARASRYSSKIWTVYRISSDGNDSTWKCTRYDQKCWLKSWARSTVNWKLCAPADGVYLLFTSLPRHATIQPHSLPTIPWVNNMHEKVKLEASNRLETSVLLCNARHQNAVNTIINCFVSVSIYCVRASLHLIF